MRRESKQFAVWDTNLSEQAFQFKAGSMGTGFIFKILDYRTQDEAKRFCEMAMEIIEDANQRFSTYLESSELSKINRGELSIEKASSVQRDVWSKAESWKELTGGFFDARTPSGKFDPSGIVKTWAAQNAANFLEANGFKEFTLNAGGDILLSSKLKDSPLTRVGLANLSPIASEDSFVNMVLELNQTDLRAVATSGSSERGEHIWRRSDAFVQANVVASDLVTADVWATALIAGGFEAFDLLPREVIAMAVTKDGQMRSTSGFYPLLAKI